MRVLFKDLPEACDNTLVIAQRCAFMLEPVKKPTLPTPPKARKAGVETTFRQLATKGLETRLDGWLGSVRARVLEDLAKTGMITADMNLVAEHSVLMDPAYVHITQRSLVEHARIAKELRARGVYSAGRYGGWTYCSIEDNILEARALVASF